MSIFEYIFLIWNIITMLIFGVDKYCAIKKKRRIRESFLILISFLMGAEGALFGMIIFNHKTSKLKFRIFIPIALIVNIISILLLK